MVPLLPICSLPSLFLPRAADWLVTRPLFTQGCRLARYPAFRDPGLLIGSLPGLSLLRAADWLVTQPFLTHGRRFDDHVAASKSPHLLPLPLACRVLRLWSCF